MRRVLDFSLFGLHAHPRSTDAGLLILRVVAGLAFALVFEKVLPRDGVWGPQPWFVEDVAAMGFPLPAVWAWAAALAEFVGGILLVLGLMTRPAALLNAIVTFVAAFVYHGAALAESGLLAFTYLAISTALVLAGPGRYSLDAVLATRRLSSSPSLPPSP